MNPTTEKRFNLAFNIFLVIGMIVAVTITTVFKLQQPGVKTFMLLLAAFGSVMGVINTVLSANGHILTFVFGFLDVLAATVVLLDNGIMGNFALHAFYFLPMQFIGFWQWRKRGAKVGTEGEEGAKVKARRLSGKQWAWLVGGILAGIAVLYTILFFVDKAQLDAGKITSFNKSKILLDAVVMTLNIAGQVLLSFAFMEQWYIWILVNISSISLWAVALMGDLGSGNAAVMLIKYIFYLMNSLNGLRIWLNLCKEPDSEKVPTANLDN
ncbi:MAG: nicotinamide mononucleotide transporter [Bacteroidales bacterium]|nr:nicotinamide mononucleotide transporter [Bacteroidales bacterium]